MGASPFQKEKAPSTQKLTGFRKNQKVNFLLAFQNVNTADLVVADVHAMPALPAESKVNVRPTVAPSHVVMRLAIRITNNLTVARPCRDRVNAIFVREVKHTLTSLFDCGEFRLCERFVVRLHFLRGGFSLFPVVEDFDFAKGMKGTVSDNVEYVSANRIRVVDEETGVDREGFHNNGEFALRKDFVNKKSV